MTISSRTRSTPAPSDPAIADHGAVFPAAPVPHLHGAASYLPQVIPVFEKLSALLRRPACVLDLGPDPDYFARHLGARGAKVTAASLRARPADESYDLVLSLGTGLLAEPVDRPQLQALGQASGVLLTDSSAIEPARSVLAGVYAFAHDLPPTGRGQHPLCFASNRFWLLSGELKGFQTYSTDPHDKLRGVHLGTRRFYFGPGTLAKVYDLEQPGLGPQNRGEWERETHFLRNVPSGIAAPALIHSGEHQGEAWLVREYVEGRPLFEVIENGTPYDPAAVLRDILAEMVALERAGLCHHDVRPWNVVVRPDGRATLIDYGAIRPQRRSYSVPSNPFASFMIFAHETFARSSLWAHAGYSPNFRLDLPEPFGGAFRAMLLQPPTDWSFAGLLRDLDAPPRIGALPPGVEILLAAASECGDALNARISVLDEKVRASRGYEEDLGRALKRVALQSEALAAASQREAELRRWAALGDGPPASMLSYISRRVTASLRTLGRLTGKLTGRRPQ
jgi:hypothetical protein